MCFSLALCFPLICSKCVCYFLVLFSPWHSHLMQFYFYSYSKTFVCRTHNLQKTSTQQDVDSVQWLRSSIDGLIGIKTEQTVGNANVNHSSKNITQSTLYNLLFAYNGIVLLFGTFLLTHARLMPLCWYAIADRFRDFAPKLFTLSILSHSHFDFLSTISMTSIPCSPPPPSCHNNPHLLLPTSSKHHRKQYDIYGFSHFDGCRDFISVLCCCYY